MVWRAAMPYVTYGSWLRQIDGPSGGVNRVVSAQPFSARLPEVTLQFAQPNSYHEPATT
jgi:hypothetical protein